MAVIGIDLGGTKLASAVFTEEGDIHSRTVRALEGREGSAVGALISETARQLFDEAAVDGLEITAVGVSVPGIFYASAGNVWAPNIPGWEDYPLLDELNDAFGPEVTVQIDSDRAAYILGETWRGTAQGCTDAVFIAVGTGIGAGILVEGRILRGRNDIGGAIGWMALDRPYRAEYDAMGCFEYNASGSGIAMVARERIAAHPEYEGELRKLPADKLTAAEVFAAHQKGDPVAMGVIDNAIVHWGMAAANLISIFNPEIIVFGGGVFGDAAPLIDRIREEAIRWAQPISVHQAEFTVSALGGDAGLYGAGRLALLD